MLRFTFRSVAFALPSNEFIHVILPCTKILRSRIGLSQHHTEPENSRVGCTVMDVCGVMGGVMDA